MKTAQIEPDKERPNPIILSGFSLDLADPTHQIWPTYNARYIEKPLRSHEPKDADQP